MRKFDKKIEICETQIRMKIRSVVQWSQEGKGSCPSADFA